MFFRTISSRWRTLLRISVRGLLLLVLVTAVPLAWLAWLAREAGTQRDAVAAIRRAGGEVRYDWQARPGKPASGRKESVPPWLVDSVGVDFFTHVTTVDLYGPTPAQADALLVHVGHLSQLEELGLNEAFFFGIRTVPTEPTPLNDHDARVVGVLLARLNGLTKLSSLAVSVPWITDAGLASFKGLANISELHLTGGQITDAGLAHLTGLSNLRELTLTLPFVSDAGLAHLEGLTNLSELSLGGAHLSDAGLVHLGRLTKLSKLVLHAIRVTDAGVAHIGALRGLSELQLFDAEVTDAGLAQLEGLTNLSKLTLLGTQQVTDAGERKLQQALPKLDIMR
jgi:hypothetical protein